MIHGESDPEFAVVEEFTARNRPFKLDDILEEIGYNLNGLSNQERNMISQKRTTISKQISNLGWNKDRVRINGKKQRIFFPQNMSSERAQGIIAGDDFEKGKNTFIENDKESEM